MPSNEKMEGFLSVLADVLETDRVSPGEDFRNARLWGSLTAFALKVTLKQKYSRDIELREISSCASAEELYSKVFPG